jgi:hypothetical protein
VGLNLVARQTTTGPLRFLDPISPSRPPSPNAPWPLILRSDGQDLTKTLYKMTQTLLSRSPLPPSRPPPFPLPASAAPFLSLTGCSLPLPLRHRHQIRGAQRRLEPDIAPGGGGLRTGGCGPRTGSRWRRRPPSAGSVHAGPSTGLSAAEEPENRRQRRRRPPSVGSSLASPRTGSRRRRNPRTGGSGGGDLPPPDPLSPARGRAPGSGGTRGRATAVEATSRL